MRVEITNRNNEKLVAFIGKKEQAAPAIPPMPGGFIREGVGASRGSTGSIRANAPRDIGGLAAVIENPDPLRDRTLLAVDKPRIDGIDIAGGVTLRKRSATPRGNSTARRHPRSLSDTNLQP